MAIISVIVRVLLIEDDQAIADFVIRGLREAGYAVSHEADGEAGLRAALEQPSDVAIVDLMLPGLDGLDVTRRLRRQGNRVPILLLTAREVHQDFQQPATQRNGTAARMIQREARAVCHHLRASLADVIGKRVDEAVFVIDQEQA